MPQLQDVVRAPAKTEGAGASSKSAAPVVIRRSKRARTPFDFGYYILIFALSAGINIWFNFFTVHADCASTCDASEYVRDAHGLMSLAKWYQLHPSTLIQDVLRGRDLQTVAVAPLTGSRPDSYGTEVTFASACKQLSELQIGGPVFPLFLALCLAVAGPHALSAPVLMQCWLSAIAAVLITDIVARSWDRRAAVLAGVFSCLYPGYIIGSGRLYSESFAVFQFVLVLWLVVRGLEKRTALVSNFFQGFALYAVQLTRSSAMVLTAIAIPLSLIRQSGRRTIAAAIIVAGLLAALLPWMSFQSIVLGRAEFVVNRTGQYNAFIGNDSKGQGWLTFPYQDGAQIEHSTVGSLLIKSIKRSPSRWFTLFMDKPLRLLKFPWNDFRLSIGPVPPAVLVLFHQIIVALAIVGIPLAFVATPSLLPNMPLSPVKLQQRLFLISSLSVTVLYLLFITVPRYNILAIPVFIALAAGGLSTLISIRSVSMVKNVAVGAGSLVSLALIRLPLIAFFMPVFEHPLVALVAACVLKAVCVIFLGRVAYVLVQGRSRAGAWTAALACCLVLPLVALPLRAHGRWFEWRSPFDSDGQVIEQSIQVPPDMRDKAATKQCYLMIDADGIRTLSSGCTITVNDVPITAPVVPGLAMIQNYKELKHLDGGVFSWEGENMFNFMTPVAGISNADLRQWFFIPVPRSVVTAGSGPLDLRVSLERTGDVKGGAIFGQYRRDDEKLELPSLTTYSWEKAFYGVENDKGLTDARLDEKVSVQPVWSWRDMSSEAGWQSGAYSIHLFVSQSPVQDSVSELAAMPVEFHRAENSPNRWNASVDTLPEVSQNDLCFMQVSLDMANLDQIDRDNLHLVSSLGDGDVTYRTPWVPLSFVDASNSGGSCKSDGMKPGAHAGAVDNDKQDDDAVYSDPSDLQFRYTIPFAPKEIPGQLRSLEWSFTGHQALSNREPKPTATVSVWRAPANPLSGEYFVF